MDKLRLQIRMTVYVTSAVMLVSAVALSVMTGRIRRYYEETLNDRLSENLTAITRIMEQRLLRVEDATETVSKIAQDAFSNGDRLDSLLVYSVSSIDNVKGVSIVFDKDRILCDGGYYEFFSYRDTTGKFLLETYVNDAEFEYDEAWQKCYVEGVSTWAELVSAYMKGKVVGYYMPLTDRDGSRFGMIYSVLLESYLTSFVAEYKVRKDMDISIYRPNGTMVVAPDDYILNLAPGDMVVRETTIDNIGWKVVLSADRKIISRRVRNALISIILLMLTMLIVIYLAIRYTVRYVARPFVEEQQRVERENAVMDNEMRLAADAQNELVPNVFPPFPGRKEIDLAACLHPARKVGGDLYDYFLCDDRLFFCIGDVSGKGVQASLFMAATHYLFRSVAEKASLSDAVRQMNVSLSADNGQCRFVTFWLGCLDLCSGALEYVNAGHDAPVLLRDGAAEMLPSSENMPLGVLDEAEFISGGISLMPGDTILLYTDGVTEAMDISGNEFEKDRLLETVEDVADTDAPGIMESVLAAIRKHSDGAAQSDDITMVCLKFNGKSSK